MNTKQLHTFEGMTRTKDDYTTSGITDTAFAAYLTATTGRTYSCAQVRGYRAVLNIPNCGTPTLKPRWVWVLHCGTLGMTHAVYDSEAKAVANAGNGIGAYSWSKEEVQ